ncbi:MAG: hypothetical protein JO303_15930, partial [Caulobacteraceae bacterium]|nr:hypothetical protein [Caulobacteraceae bacterium]
PDSISDLVPKVESYRRMAAEAGRQSTICLMRDFHIAETRAAVDPNWLANSVETNRKYQKAKSTAAHDAVGRRVLAGETVSFDEYVPNRAVAGAPDDCIREVARAREALRCEYMMLTPVGVPDPAQQLRELRLFAREVAPQFAE